MSAVVVSLPFPVMHEPYLGESLSVQWTLVMVEKIAKQLELPEIAHIGYIAILHKRL
jgi:hypothetical protein